MNDAVARDNKYQYNGKEWNDDWGLKWNDYGARWYMADVGRWGAVDPLAESFQSWSPYHYTYNNPLVFTDPDGRSGEPVFDKNTKTITIYSNLVLYGAAASQELAVETAKDIENAWNAANGEVGGYKVRFSVTGSFRSDLTQEEVANNTDIRNNYIKVVEDGISISGMDGPDKNGDGQQEPGGNTGVWLLSNIKGEGTTTEAHEFGHGFGLVADSPANGFHSESDQKGKGRPDIMAARGTLVDSKFQYDSKAAAGSKGGTVNPETRTVTKQNVAGVISNIRYNKNGTSLWRVGELINRFH